MTDRVAIVLVLRNGKPLVIDRASPPCGVGLPGGYVEEGETYAEAAARELYEETALNIEPGELTRLLRTEKETGGGFLTAFVCESNWGRIYGSDEGKVRWGSWSELRSKSPFPETNKAVIDAAREEGWL